MHTNELGNVADINYISPQQYVGENYIMCGTVVELGEANINMKWKVGGASINMEWKLGA